jgi:hypothetical protein
MLKMQYNLAYLKITGQMNTSVSFQKYVTCGDNIVTCKVQKIMNKILPVTCLRERRKMVVENINLQKHFCHHWKDEILP